MDANLLIGIIGLILAIVGTMFGYRSYRDQAKTKIFFFSKEYLKLYDDLLKNIPDLAITFRGTPIRESMFILKGVFICSGNKDIVDSDVQKGITLRMNGTAPLWHTFKVTNKTNNLDLISAISGEDLTIDFPLLKDQDFFVIEALGETDTSSVNLNHRINNVPAIEHNSIGVKKKIRSKMINWITVCITCLALFLIGFILVSRERWKPYLSYRIGKNTFEISDNYYVDANYSRIINEDSIRQIARRDFSTVSLFLNGRTKAYKTNTSFFVTFSLSSGRNIILLELSLCVISLIILLFSLFKIFRETIRYYYISRVEDLATSLLKE